MILDGEPLGGMEREGKGLGLGYDHFLKMDWMDFIYASFPTFLIFGLDFYSFSSIIDILFVRCWMFCHIH